VSFPFPLLAAAGEAGGQFDVSLRNGSDRRQLHHQREYEKCFLDHGSIPILSVFTPNLKGLLPRPGMGYPPEIGTVIASRAA
jgi:hypothetical protein